MSSTGQLSGCSDSSLEHCYTNIFALTDFSGIQYRKYVLRSEKEYKSALEDPLIKSYALCQKNSVLSAWVRCKRDSLEKQDPCVSAKFQKELWVFWYGNGDFPNADSCILPELCEEDRGNWRQGLSYETRTVLFRALHNVVEKCLLNKGFVRLGKWFIQPYKHNYHHDYIQYSVGFSFFLHGESTVCASLDLRQHPLVRRIGLKHLQLCSVNQRTIPVVLAPYGISAELVGVGSSQKNEDISSDYECWCNFYPLRSTNEQEYDDSSTVGLPQFAKTTPSLQATRHPGQLKHNSSDKKANENLFKGPDSTPTFVEVIAGGFRMRYPTCYVLLCDADWDDQSSNFIHQDTNKLKSAQPATKRNLSSTQFNFEIKSESSAIVGLREPKTSSLWRFPRRKILASVSFASAGLKNVLRSAKDTLQSNLAFDVRRIYLAERALRLSCHDIFLPSTVRRTWSHSERQPSCDTEFSVAVTDVQPTACVHGLSARCPFTKCICTCLR
ncbi:mediator of RNA polymerase II transcription subunit 13 [Paragonimus westermani]|uniref:Mediator of RNA polymerase II transcription subunit 13 n=1 Tax=Paragonimus westermani TaxID=34504 RepID=A0A5J4N5Y4_9TREM|nr:mediator of RNA polymerase II transcription subunit 13 [Paragonimus westermani]